MKLTEQQKVNLSELIESSLKTAKMKYHLDEDGEAYPLLDYLSHTGNTIKSGLEEIENISSHIYFDMDEWDI